MNIPFIRKKSTVPEAVAMKGAPLKAVKGKSLAEFHSPGSLKRFLLSLNNMGLSKYRSAFIQNLAMMLGAGLHVTDALAALTQESQKKPMRKIVQNILSDVENGSALWRAMDRAAFFTPYTIALVRIGEESGNLSDNLDNLAAQDEKDQSMKQKVKMAMIYPSIVIALTIVIAVGLSWFVLPQLIGVLFALDVELPVTTRAVIAVADYFTENGATVVPTGLVVIIILTILCKFTKLKYVSQWVTLHIPGIKTLIIEASTARFGIILGSLLQAGVPPVKALQSLTEVTTILRYKSFYAKLTEHIQIGDSFAKSFESIRRSRKVLPLSVQQIIVTGERSGRLSEVLLKIADIYQKKAEETAKKLPIILEPMLLIVIAGLVGVIAFSIILPIYSVVGNISGR